MNTDATPRAENNIGSDDAKTGKRPNHRIEHANLLPTTSHWGRSSTTSCWGHSLPKAPLGEMSNGKVPQRLNAAINMRMALDGVVPTSWVAAAKARPSRLRGSCVLPWRFLFETTVVRIDAGHAAGRRAVKATRLARIRSLFLRRWYYLVFLSITPQIEYHTRPHGDGGKRIILLLS